MPIKFSVLGLSEVDKTTLKQFVFEIQDGSLVHVEGDRHVPKGVYRIRAIISNREPTEDERPHADLLETYDGLVIDPTRDYFEFMDFIRVEDTKIARMF